MAGTIVANTINTDTAGAVFTTNNALNGVAKAWVQFQGGNGNTAGTINGSFNVSSITVNGTGEYTVNYTTAMTNANYAWAASGYRTNSLNQASASVSAPTTTALRLSTLDAAGAITNMILVTLTVFGA